jgi:hypothetical protein
MHMAEGGMHRGGRGDARACILCIPPGYATGYGFTTVVNKIMLKIQNRPSTVEVKVYKKVKPLYPSHYTDTVPIEDQDPVSMQIIKDFSLSHISPPEKDQKCV